MLAPGVSAALHQARRRLDEFQRASRNKVAVGLARAFCGAALYNSSDAPPGGSNGPQVQGEAAVADAVGRYIGLDQLRGIDGSPRTPSMLRDPAAQLMSSWFGVARGT